MAAGMGDHGRNRHRPKVGAAVPLSVREAELGPHLTRPGSPPNTMSAGLRPTSLPSGILMHPVVWPQ